MYSDKLAVQLSKWQSLDALLRYFSTEARCRAFLLRILYPSGLRCPKCGGIVIYDCGRIYHCDECNHNFTITTRTIFHSTKLPLRKWFTAIWLLINNKKGCNSCMLSRELGITQTTAWHMLHKIRRVLSQEDISLSGTVQVDAAYVGGQLRWIASSVRRSSHDYLRNKISVLGIVGDKLVMRAIPEGAWTHIRPILEHTLDKNAVVHSDSGKEFIRIARDLGLLHLVCDHSRGQFVNNGVSTNKIEGAWAHLKRQTKGVYHLMPKKHSQRYIDEFVWRYNTRQQTNIERVRAFFPNITVKITWRDITHPN